MIDKEPEYAVLVHLDVPGFIDDKVTNRKDQQCVAVIASPPLQSN